jgi:hypothetical protein
LSLTETVYRRQIRPFGKTKKSLGKVHLPDGLARELLLWKGESPDPSPDAFIFPNTTGGFLDVGNYRYRVLKPLADKLGIPKLPSRSCAARWRRRPRAWGRLKTSRLTCGTRRRTPLRTSTCRHYLRAFRGWLVRCT